MAAVTAEARAAAAWRLQPILIHAASTSCAPTAVRLLLRPQHLLGDQLPAAGCTGQPAAEHPAPALHNSQTCCVPPPAPHLRRRVVLLAELHDVHTLQKTTRQLNDQSVVAVQHGIAWQHRRGAPRPAAAALVRHSGRCHVQSVALAAAAGSAHDAAKGHANDCCTATMLQHARQSLQTIQARSGGSSARAGRTLAPSAGPTGGAGLALPAGSASLIMPVTAGGREGVRATLGRSQKCARRCPRALPEAPGPTHPWPPCK